MTQRREDAKKRRNAKGHLAAAVCLLALLVALSALPAHAQETPAATPAASSTLQECSTVSEETLLDELNSVTQAVFADALARVDIQAIVDDQWAEQGLTPIVRVEIDRAVERVRQDTDYWNTFLSGWSAEKARALSLAVANRAFASEPFRQGIEGLSTAVAEAIAQGISTISAEGSSAALYCLQTFIQGSYSPALLAAFQDEVAAATGAVSDAPPGVDPTLLSVIGEHRLALGGIGVIIAAQVARRIVTRIATNMSRRVAGRVTGRVLGRLGTTVIPLAGWIIGGGMLIYDVWDSANGALPQIQETLKSEEVMVGIRTEIADAIRPELELEIPTVAREIANDLYSQWLAVKRDIRVILELAGENAAYAELLDSTETEEDLARLVSVSSALLTSGGQQAVLDAAESGALQRALELRADITPIVQATGSLDAALAWNESAGTLLDDVVRLEIYKGKQPGALDRATLQRLIAVQDPAVVARLALLPLEQLTALLALSGESLRALGAALTPEQLGWLAETVAGLEPEARNALVARLVSDPSIIAQLQQTNLLDVLPPGADLDTALGFMAGRNDTMGMVNDAVRVMTGGPTVGMYQAKYGWGVTALTFAALLLLALIALRLVWALGAWVLEPVFSIGRVGRRARGTQPPPQPPPPYYPPYYPPQAPPPNYPTQPGPPQQAPPQETISYGPTPTRPRAQPPAQPPTQPPARREDDAQ